jgi:hypothetical protein
MIFQSAMDPKTAQETIFRAVRSATTKTSTVTIAIGTPLVLETATASADGAFVRQAATSTDITNNLYVGNAHAALNPESVGLAQCYGVDTDAVVITAGASVGANLIPNVASLATVGTNTNGNPGVVGGGAGVLTVLIAPSGAATASTSVFVRAL